MSKYNWRNSGNGRYMKEGEAKKLPPNQVEKEQRKSNQSQSKRGK